jgi:hypothetical protein
MKIGDRVSYRDGRHAGKGYIVDMHNTFICIRLIEHEGWHLGTVWNGVYNAGGYRLEDMENITVMGGQLDLFDR